MPPKFEWVTDGQTVINPIGLAFTLAMGILLVCLPRRYALVPVIALMFYMTMGMRVIVLGLNITMMRILLPFGLLRLLARGELRGVRLNSIDKTNIWFGISGMIVYTLLFQSYDAFKYKLGGFYTAIGFYLLFRYLIRDYQDTVRLFLWISLLLAPLAGAMIFESVTGRNPFAAFGGVPEFTVIRNGKLRCQGPFAHPILAGSIGAALAPFSVALWWCRKRLAAVIGLISATVIIITCASSGPILAYAGGLMAMCFWPARRWMRAIRWGIACVLVCLHITMKVPVWFLLARVTVVGGSTGYHRAYLIDRAIASFPDWWLTGAKSTAAWASKDAHLFDVTNQYIAHGADGGIVTMVLFILVIAFSFGAVGRLARRADKTESICIWALGASLFSHAIGYMSICYFDQNLINYQLLIATISSVSGSYVVARSAAKSPRGQRRIDFAAAWAAGTPAVAGRSLERGT